MVCCFHTVTDVWQASHLGVARVGMWSLDLPTPLPEDVTKEPLWQVKQVVVLTTAWFICGLSHRV